MGGFCCKRCHASFSPERSLPDHGAKCERATAKNMGSLERAAPDPPLQPLSGAGFPGAANSTGALDRAGLHMRRKPVPAPEKKEQHVKEEEKEADCEVGSSCTGAMHAEDKSVYRLTVLGKAVWVVYCKDKKSLDFQSSSCWKDEALGMLPWQEGEDLSITDPNVDDLGTPGRGEDRHWCKMLDDQISERFGAGGGYIRTTMASKGLWAAGIGGNKESRQRASNMAVAISAASLCGRQAIFTTELRSFLESVWKVIDSEAEESSKAEKTSGGKGVKRPPATPQQGAKRVKQEHQEEVSKGWSVKEEEDDDEDCAQPDEQWGKKASEKEWWKSSSWREATGKAQWKDKNKEDATRQWSSGEKWEKAKSEGGGRWKDEGGKWEELGGWKNRNGAGKEESKWESKEESKWEEAAWKERKAWHADEQGGDVSDANGSNAKNGWKASSWRKERKAWHADEQGGDSSDANGSNAKNGWKASSWRKDDWKDSSWRTGEREGPSSGDKSVAAESGWKDGTWWKDASKSAEKRKVVKEAGAAEEKDMDDDWGGWKSAKKSSEREPKEEDEEALEEELEEEEDDEDEDDDEAWGEWKPKEHKEGAEKRGDAWGDRKAPMKKGHVEKRGRGSQRRRRQMREQQRQESAQTALGEAELESTRERLEASEARAGAEPEWACAEPGALQAQRVELELLKAEVSRLRAQTEGSSPDVVKSAGPEPAQDGGSSSSSPVIILQPTPKAKPKALAPAAPPALATDSRPRPSSKPAVSWREGGHTGAALPALAGPMAPEVSPAPLAGGLQQPPPWHNQPAVPVSSGRHSLPEEPLEFDHDSVHEPMELVQPVLRPRPPDTPPPVHLLAEYPPISLPAHEVDQGGVRVREALMESSGPHCGDFQLRQDIGCTIQSFPVSEVFYTQDTINGHFRGHIPFASLLRKLETGEVDPESADFLLLDGYMARDHYLGRKVVSFANRRLHCLKLHAQRTGYPVMVRMRILHLPKVYHEIGFKHITRNGGATVDVRKR